MRRFIIMLGVALASVVFAACGDDGGSSTASAAGEFNDADVTFTQGMIPHHEQAIEMSELALDPKAAASVKTKDVATRIKQAQDPEITTMRGWLRAWRKSEMADYMAGHDMAGMMSTAEMTALAKLTGTQFDRSWAEMMIKHHQGAIEMANTVKKSGKNADVRKVADQIAAAQTAEITELQSMIK
jgi:uncharacterized protein (DUF305 family)